MGAPDGEKDIEDDLDAGWDDDEEEDDEDLDEVDSGWEDVEAQGGQPAPGAPAKTTLRTRSWSISQTSSRIRGTSAGDEKWIAPSSHCCGRAPIATSSAS